MDQTVFEQKKKRKGENLKQKRNKGSVNCHLFHHHTINRLITMCFLKFKQSLKVTISKTTLAQHAYN